MNPDEQEAGSHKYIAPMVLALSSGNWAVFDRRRQLIGIYTSIVTVGEVVQANSKPPPPEERKPRNNTLSLEDLGL